MATRMSCLGGYLCGLVRATLCFDPFPYFSSHGYYMLKAMDSAANQFMGISFFLMGNIVHSVLSRPWLCLTLSQFLPWSLLGGSMEDSGSNAP